MKYKEAYPTLFATIFAVDFAEAFEKIFGNVSASDLDTVTCIRYGEKLCPMCITSDNANTMAKTVISLNVDNWLRQAEVMGITYDISNPTTSTVTGTESTTGSTSDTGSTTESDVPFNASTFSDRDKQATQNATETTGSKNTTTTTKGLGSRSIQSEIGKELSLRATDWRKSIIFALINQLTLNIY